MRTPLLSHTLSRLATVGRVLGCSDAEIGSASGYAALACASFAHRLDEAAPWPSDLTDDGTPFELSVTYGGRRPELRILAEVQGERPGPEASWAAGRAATERWSELGASTHRLALVEELFAPTSAAPHFAWWHALVLAPSGPLVKVYLNPRAAGDGAGRARVLEALARLGHAGVDVPGPEPSFFSLDLVDGPHARVKVYTPLWDARPDEVERVAARAADHEAGTAAALCRAAAGEGPYRSRPVLVCASYVSGSARPSQCTVHVPIRCYAADDVEAGRRIDAVLDPADRPVHAAVVRAMASRPLDAGSGLQTYVSRRAGRAGRRVTVYLAPELYRARSVET
jgi:DMATS type aromatic prenyltransferase